MHRRSKKGERDETEAENLSQCSCRSLYGWGSVAEHKSGAIGSSRSSRSSGLCCVWFSCGSSWKRGRENRGSYEQRERNRKRKKEEENENRLTLEKREKTRFGSFLPLSLSLSLSPSVRLHRLFSQRSARTMPVSIELLLECEFREKATHTQTNDGAEASSIAASAVKAPLPSLSSIDRLLHENSHHTARGGDPEVVRDSIRKRFSDPAIVDKVIELDAAWREGEIVFSSAAFRRSCSTSFPLTFSSTPKPKKT